MGGDSSGMPADFIAAAVMLAVVLYLVCVGLAARLIWRRRR